MSRAETLLKAAKTAGVTVTVAESCTGGLLAGAITDVPGSSAIFERGFVTYSNQAKVDMLGVSSQTLADFGAVSEQVARQMAEGARAAAQADFALSVTGIAGPGGSEFKPEGRVCFGLTHAGGTISITQEFGALGRAHVRKASVEYGLKLLLQAVDNQL